MNKKEFLSQLRDELAFVLPPSIVQSNVNYYASYIDGEIRKGRSAGEVLSELGDPKLIARTIVDALKSGADGIPGTADDVVFPEHYEDGAAGRGPSGTSGGQSAGSGASGGGSTAGASGYGTERESGSRSGNSYQRTDYREEGGSRTGGWQQLQYQSGCFGCLLSLLVFGVIFSVIGWFVGGVVALISPILGPVCMVLLILWLLKKLRN